MTDKWNEEQIKLKAALPQTVNHLAATLRGLLCEFDPDTQGMLLGMSLEKWLQNYRDDPDVKEEVLRLTIKFMTGKYLHAASNKI